MLRSTLSDLKDPEVRDGVIRVLDVGGEKLIQASERFMSNAFNFKDVASTVCKTALGITVIVVLYKTWEQYAEHRFRSKS